MKRSYIDYAMSVIVSRALPDVRDGLKPVHRRILYAMKEGGYDSTKAFRKSARVVGDVIGKYHPHSEAAIYDALVRMAQDFSMGVMLIEGQGNYGSMDGDGAAAMRYTEARLRKVAETMLEDIDKETVLFQPNYDNSEFEPEVLPASFPNVLVNGAVGIAVGMATSIPPHNLGEVLDACLAMLHDPAIDDDTLLTHVHGPDFPTGGIILGQQGAKEALKTGRGRVLIRARTSIEEPKRDRNSIVVTEVPFQTNKSRLIEKIADMVRAGTIENISDIRDESDRDGVRVVFELKKGAIPDVVLSQLYKHSGLQTSFSIQMLALHDGKPQTMSLRQVLEAFLVFRDDVIVRRSRFQLNRSRTRAHVLVGLLCAVAHLDDVITLIREAADVITAREQLMARTWGAASILPFIRMIDNENWTSDEPYQLSETQARAILELRLQRLTGMERNKLEEEARGLVEDIERLNGLVNDPELRRGLMVTELTDIRTKFATPRRTEIADFISDIDEEDLIQREDMVVTLTHRGYIKRVPLSVYRAQRRGGKGLSGVAVMEDDFVCDLFVASTHDELLFFTDRGMVYSMKVWRLPMSSRQSRGRAIVNLIPLTKTERVTRLLSLPSQGEVDSYSLILATASGHVRRNSLRDFTEVKRNGKRAIKLDTDDSLIGAVITPNEGHDILLSSRRGMAIRFAVDGLRVFASRSSIGVRGLRLRRDDRVVSLAALSHSRVVDSIELRDQYLRGSTLYRRRLADPSVALSSDDAKAVDAWMNDPQYQNIAAEEQIIVTITSDGYGKRSSAYEYRMSNRGGVGIAGIEFGNRVPLLEHMTDDTPGVVASFIISAHDDLMLITRSGQMIRIPVKDVRVMGRRTQGVRLFRLDEKDEDEYVVSVVRLERSEEDAEADDPDSGAEASNAGSANNAGNAESPQGAVGGDASSDSAMPSSSSLPDSSGQAPE
ncbi:MAG: DNA gyrase subunit A [Alphaproteobacteria bacterium]|nr:DNA gyrase subunit A [Alphaproteobacteria bacterium]